MIKNIVLEKTPNSITREIIEACKQVVQNSEPFFVLKKNFSEGQINKCTYNVKNYLSKYGGESILGWEVVIWRKVLIRLLGHAIVKSDNDLFCVTPTKYQNTKILFIKDPNLTFDFTNISSRMPTKIIPLNSSKMVRDFIEVENRIREIKIKYLVTSSNILLQGDDAISMQNLENEKQNLLNRLRNIY